jgi:hypothetical protein
MIFDEPAKSLRVRSFGGSFKPKAFPKTPAPYSRQVLRGGLPLKASSAKIVKKGNHVLNKVCIFIELTIFPQTAESITNNHVLLSGGGGPPDPKKTGCL